MATEVIRKINVEIFITAKRPPVRCVICFQSTDVLLGYRYYLGMATGANSNVITY